MQFIVLEKKSYANNGRSPTLIMSDRIACVDIIIPRGPLGFEFSIKSSGSQIVISQVRAGGAAELAGLKVGCIVKAVNQQSIKDMSFLQVSNLIRRSSSLTTELTVCMPEDIHPAAYGNVVLRHTSAIKNPTSAPYSSSDCENVSPSPQRIRTQALMEQQQKSQHGREEVAMLAQVLSPSAEVLSFHSCQHPLTNKASHDDNGCGMNHCGLRRQAILFCNDAIYVTEPPDLSPPISSISDHKPVPGGNIDNIVSSFSTTLNISENRREEDEKAEITPPLVRRQAYPSPISSVLATNPASPSSLVRNMSVKAGEETAPSPRFLPAHTSPTLQREESPQPTFLPRLSVRRKISSPALSARPSPPNEPKFTNLAAYMDGLIVPPPNGSTSGIVQRCLSVSSGVRAPPCFVLTDNSLSTLPLSHDILSLSPKNLSSNNETTNTNAKQPHPKRKRLTSMTELFRTDYPYDGSHWLASWRRRRRSLRPQEKSSDIKTSVPSIPTAEANPSFRPKPLKTSDLQSEFYKSPLCLCKVTKIEGKNVAPVAWRRFYIYIGGDYIRFLLASDYHDFNQHASDSLLNNVDPFTLVGVSTSRCIILPLMGLQWSSHPFLASDIPTWDTLSPASPASTSFFRRNNQSSQYSEMVESEPTNDLDCYLFEHESNGCSEITVIFPEAQTLSKTLELCQRHGGFFKESNPPPNFNVINSSSLETSHLPKQLSHHVTAVLHRSRKSLPDSAARRRLAADVTTGTKRTRDRSLGREGEQSPPLGFQRSAGVEDSSKFRFFATTAAPFFKSIANAISSARATDFNAASNNATAALQISEKEIARRVEAALGEPPDFGDLNQPGPVFGAPLEKQVPSPDYPNIPLVVHATISALELHGLYHVGLYRAPGRQKEINRFVCLANLTSLDPHVMLSLATWNDVRVLTGVIKVFFRRLPEPICDPDSWKSLACLIPEDSDELDKSSLVYTLQAIRAKLNKIRSTSYLPLNASPTEQVTSMVSWRWRYATLDFLFTHLRRIIALEVTNQCSFKCIAICFGPSLFNADNDLQNKFNVLLEVMLQHWPWLTADESKALKDDSIANLSHNPSAAPRSTTISETEAYVKQFLENGPSFHDLSFSSVGSQQDSLKIIDDIKNLFERAGYQVSARNSLENSDNRKEEEEQEEESLLDVIMRSLPQHVNELDGEQNASSISQLSSPIFQSTEF
nr:Rho GTPase activating protein 21 [Hymenolepis microstoma]